MKMFAAIAVVLGMFLIQGAPVAQAQECEQRLNEAERQIRELQQQIPQLTGGSSQGETRRTTTGAVFTRVHPVHRDFGESWRDPSGMIWGDTAKNADGSIRHMDQYQATEYCESRGFLLPLREEFIRLREYMGAKPWTSDDRIPPGYTPQVLPNLTRHKDGWTYGNFFWASSVHSFDSNVAYVLDGRSGDIKGFYRADYVHGAVRCVARR